MRSPRAERFNTPAAFSAPLAGNRPEREQGFAGRHALRIEPQRRARRVMRGEHSGRERRVIGRGGGIGERAPQRALDRLARHAAGPQQHRRAEAGDDGGFDADPRRAAVDDEIDAAAQIGEHVRRRASARHGRSDWPTAPRSACRTSEKLLRHVVIGNAHRDGVEARGRELGDGAAGGLRQHQRQRSRPESFGQPRRIGVEARERARRPGIGDMRNQRIERGPAFGLVKPRDGPAIGRIGAEAVNGLGRKGDKTAGLRQRTASPIAASSARNTRVAIGAVMARP